jgi:hypothetical protein
MQVQLQVCIRFFHIKKVNSIKLLTLENVTKLSKVKMSRIMCPNKFLKVYTWRLF